MKIYVVVKYTDVSVFGMCGDTEYVTETEMIESYSTKQDANFERKYLNDDVLQKKIIFFMMQLNWS